MTTLNLTTSSPKCSPISKVTMKPFVFHVSEMALSYEIFSENIRHCTDNDPSVRSILFTNHTPLPTVQLCQVASGQRLFPPQLYLSSVDLHVLLRTDQQLVAYSLNFEIRKLIAWCSKEYRWVIFRWCSRSVRTFVIKFRDVLTVIVNVRNEGVK
jgi:hypothetical protein